MDTVEGAGVELAYEERGAGAPILLIHGLASDALGLAPVAEQLAGQGRTIAYDRRGYGASGAPTPYAGTTAEEQGEDAAALLRALDAAPALVVGDGFGALVALALALRHRDLVRAVVLSNPPLHQLVPEATEALGQQRLAIEEAVRAGGPADGVEAWLGGRVEDEALARARASHLGFYADFAGLATLSVTRRELRELSLPAAIVTGSWSPPTIVAAADVLAELLPDARRSHDGDLVAAAARLAAA